MQPPIPRKVKLAGENNSVSIEWSDGHVSLYPYKFLREKCPCATCTDAQGTGAPRTNVVVESPLPMLQKALRPEKAELVGRYAVQINWSDGHSTGIYSFDYLRGLCPCGECRGPRC
jgi:DUF971 family protein